MEKLIVKNFGAIKDIEIELKDLTIFIGKSGTGKSTLAKLIAIFRDADFWVNQNFEAQLEKHQITVPYLKVNTEIFYESNYLVFEYKENSSHYDFTDKFITKVNDSVNKDDLQSIDDLKELQNKSHTKKSKFENTLEILLKKLIKQSYIIPAERQLTASLNGGYSIIDRKADLLKEFLPNSLLDFVGEHNFIGKALSGSYISLFDVVYERGENGEDYIILPDKTKLLLRIAASGMQTAIPALLVMDYYSQDKEQKRSFVFEEPELNLFPYAQGDLMKFIAEKVLNRGHQLVICTHSDHIFISTLVLCKKLEDEGEGIDRNTTQIYFLTDEKDSEQAVLIPILEQGTIMHPPKDFFDKIYYDQQYLMGF